MQTESKAVRKKLIDHLPAIYQEPEWRPDHDSTPPLVVCPICGETEKPPEHANHLQHRNHLREFLEAFDKVLMGFEEEGRDSSKAGHHERPGHVEGLGRKIEGLHEVFDPNKTPREFLPWLASWAALSLRTGLDIGRQRRLIAKIIPLYQIRGTKKYLEELLRLCVDVPTSVTEVEDPPLQVGVQCTVGEDTYVGGGPPYYFRVGLVATDLNAAGVETQRQIAYDVIERAKPAHTTYELNISSPRMQVGIHSTIGLDTLLAPVAA